MLFVANSNVKAVVIKSAKSGNFIAGADITMLASANTYHRLIFLKLFLFLLSWFLLLKCWRIITNWQRSGCQFQAPPLARQTQGGGDWRLVPWRRPRARALVLVPHSHVIAKDRFGFARSYVRLIAGRRRNASKNSVRIVTQISFFFLWRSFLSQIYSLKSFYRVWLAFKLLCQCFWRVK